MSFLYCFHLAVDTCYPYIIQLHYATLYSVCLHIPLRKWNYFSSLSCGNSSPSTREGVFLPLFYKIVQIPSLKIYECSLSKQISMYFWSMSIRQYFLFRFFAARPVVPLPQKGSSTKSPSLLLLHIAGSIHCRGFSLG